MSALALIAYYGAYAYPAVPAFAAWAWPRGAWRARAVILAALLAATCLAYGRFVEPRLLLVRDAEIALPGAPADGPAARIALVADVHFGGFGHAVSIERIVRRIEALDVDAVMLAGDFVYRPRAGEIDRQLAPLARLDLPVFAVLGNHDVGLPGLDASALLREALARHGVTLLEERIADIELANGRLHVAGFTDLWLQPPDTGHLNTRSDHPLLLLAHNPDTALALPAGTPYDLMLSGHTHGGQIRLPVLYKAAIPCEGPFDEGLHRLATGGGERLVYVTAGTGMVGLPFRFAVPPRIDVLTLRLPVPTAPAVQAATSAS